ncbi:MAG TPA: hypothetical protein VE270_04135 [Thermoleophilaceae bacterium]|jgi:hypothetical protein|nr:hypothetical protein [Thermoleophilaceae bacterium]
MASEILLTRGTSQREQFIDLLEGKTEKEVFDPEEPPVPVGWAVRWDRQPADVACAGVRTGGYWHNRSARHFPPCEASDRHDLKQHAGVPRFHG